MNFKSQIVQLVDKVKAIEGSIVSVGTGPKHPMDPSENYSDDLKAYWNAYPYLTKDYGYVAFMEIYCGIHIYRPDVELSVDVFGFSDASSQIIRINKQFLLLGESNIIEDGLLVFSDVTLPSDEEETDLHAYPDNLLGTGFGFKPEETGIFKAENLTPKQLIEGVLGRKYYYCSSFIEWLSILVECKGNFPEKDPQ